ncbi:replicative helicase loader/inhibitor [Jeotgalibacillus aurantiacus]|uniref:replicative helicase loader/inhibitor n=1 Tax=Jeotgalibacillus aurantiacus TaxID=2763266 RepID=UPI001D0BADC0|nr:replicative helicase loader/inhibitor [Jeotgalibacillus aurantiacus]
MTKRELLQLFKTIAHVYPSFDWDQGKIDVWHRMIKDQDYEATERVLDAYMQDNRFPPTIADLRVKSAGLQLNVPDLQETKQYINTKLAEGSQSATGNHPERLKALETIRKGLGIRD